MRYPKPNLFEFQDLWAYLKAVYKYRKHFTANFSYQSWAAEMGLRSRSYLRALVMGTKPLQENLLGTFLKGLDLNNDEVAYFSLLFRYQVTTDETLRGLYARELLTLWKTKLRETTIIDIAEFVADPIIPTLFTYLSFDEVSGNLSTIAKDLACDVSRVRKALQSLVWHRLVEGSVLENGQISYKTVTPFFSIPLTPSNQHLKQFHIEGIRSAQAAAELPSEIRKMYSCFIALDDEQFKTVQAMIMDFNKRLLGIMESRGLAGKKIYRLNQQIFPVSEKVDSLES